MKNIVYNVKCKWMLFAHCVPPFKFQALGYHFRGLDV